MAALKCLFCGGKADLLCDSYIGWERKRGEMRKDGYDGVVAGPGYSVPLRYRLRHRAQNLKDFMNDQTIETEIQAKGKTAPRVTPADLQANIDSEFFFTARDGIEGAAAEKGEFSAPHVIRHTDAVAETHTRLLTFCVLVLKNGFTVTGESACASPENFDAEIGRKAARENAVAKVWPLMGYALKTELARPVLTESDAAADLAGTPRPARA